MRNRRENCLGCPNARLQVSAGSEYKYTFYIIEEMSELGEALKG